MIFYSIEVYGVEWRKFQMKKIILICFILSLFLGGCWHPLYFLTRCRQPRTPSDIEQDFARQKKEIIENPGSICRFTVNENYQQVCRIIQTRIIYMGFLPEEIKGDFPEEVKVELYPDIEKAEIDIFTSGRCSISISGLFDIVAISPDASEITMYHSQWLAGSQWLGKDGCLSHCAQWKRFFEGDR